MFNLVTEMRARSKKIPALITGITIVAASLLMPASPALADTATVSCSVSGNFTIQNHEVSSSTSDCAGEVVIPADVTVIGQGAFSNRHITSAVFAPNSQLIEISTYSFEFTDITSISFPSGLKYIDSTSFTFAKFTSISIPGTVETIGWGAFYGTSLTNVTFEPRSTSNILIADGAFVNCNDLVSINFTGPVVVSGGIGAPRIKTDFNWAGWSSSMDGPVVSFPLTITQSGVTTLYPVWSPQEIAIVDCSLSGTFKIVDHVLKSSTDDCAGAVTIPADVTLISNGAFSRKNITNVTIAGDSQLTRIAEYAFEFTNIASINLPTGLQSIGHGAFSYAKFTTLSIPGTVETIEGSPFYGADIETVVFQTRVASTLSVNRDAFIYTHSLRSITFLGPISFDSEPFGHTLYANDWLGWGSGTNGPLVTYPLTSTDSAGITLYPQSAARTYTATYDSRGGTEVAPGNIVGGRIIFPDAPTRTGYTFLGWYDNPSSSDPVMRWDYDSGATFYAKWIPNTYTVNFNSNGGSEVVSTSFVTDGDISTAPDAPTKYGYVFSGWAATEDGTAVSFPYAPGVTQNITLYALWTVLTPTIMPGTAANSLAVSIPAGLNEATIPATANVPSVKLQFPVSSSNTGATITPIANPESAAFTPFVVTGSTKIVDIELTGISGEVTICLDGAPTDHLYHYTGGQWVDLPQRSYSNGQVCGVTSSFSPFAAAAPAPFKPRLKAVPSLSGNAHQNTFLNLGTGTWMADPIASTSQQWYRCDKKIKAGLAKFTAEMMCKKISGATLINYKVKLADQGKYITALVKASNSLGSTLSSTKSIRVPMATNPKLKSAPKISGTIAKGNFVSLTSGTWSANPTAATTQQWYRCDTRVPAGLSTFSPAMNCKKISGAKGTQYKIVAADQSKYLTALVTAKNSQGMVLKSAKSVRAPGIKPTMKSSPKISGSAKTGAVLGATFGTWSALPTATTSVQWYRCSSSVAAGATTLTSAMHCKKISGATTIRHTVVKADEGKYLTVLVKAKNADGSTVATAKSIFVRIPPSKL